MNSELHQTEMMEAIESHQRLCLEQQSLPLLADCQWFAEGGQHVSSIPLHWPPALGRIVNLYVPRQGACCGQELSHRQRNPDCESASHDYSSGWLASEKQQLQDQVSADLISSGDFDGGTTHLELYW